MMKLIKKKNAIVENKKGNVKISREKNWMRRNQ